MKIRKNEMGNRVKNGVFAGIFFFFTFLCAVQVFAGEGNKFEYLEYMEPAIRAYLNQDSYTPSEGNVKELDLSSGNKERFWSVMYLFSIYNSKYHGSTYSLDEVAELAYALFSDFDGKLPDFPDRFYETGGNTFLDGNNLRFFYAQSEEQSFEMVSVNFNDDNSIDAVYSQTWQPFHPEAPSYREYFAHVHLIPCSHFEEFPLDHYRYKLDSIRLSSEWQLTELPDYTEEEPARKKGNEEWFQMFFNSPDAAYTINGIYQDTYVISGLPEFDKYCSIDLNSDGINELILLSNQRGAIFSFDGETIVPIMYVNYFRNLLYDEKNNNFIVQVGTSSESDYYVFRLEGESFQQLIRLFLTTSSAYDTPVYRINEEKYDKDEFYEIYDEMKGNAVSLSEIGYITAPWNPDNTDLSGQKFTFEEIEPETEPEDTKSANQYIIPDSDSRYLTESDLSTLTKEELRLARNEIFARKGRKFTTADLQEYFDSQAWYQGTIEANDFDISLLSEIESYNADFIREFESSH